MMPPKRDRKSGWLAAMTVTAGRGCVGCWSKDSDRSERREALSKDFLFATRHNGTRFGEVGLRCVWELGFTWAGMSCRCPQP